MFASIIVGLVFLAMSVLFFEIVFSVRPYDVSVTEVVK
jgi:hypothetical protein